MERKQNNASKLLEYKKKIEEAEALVNELNGKAKHLKEELTNVWQCSTVKEAKNKLEEINESIDTLQEEIDSEMELLEKEYDL
jgi:uncharacterized coiled-coil DUF342 family protein